MTTSVVEKPVTLDPIGAHIEIADKRTIGLTAEFRCTRPTKVSNGLDAPAVECGAEAFFHVTYPHGLERYICAHHAHKEWDTITRVAISIRDESGFINKAASASS